MRSEKRNRVIRGLLKTVVVIADLLAQIFIVKYAVVLPFQVFIMTDAVGMEKLLCLLLGVMIGFIGISMVVSMWILLVFLWLAIEEFLW